MCPQLDEGSGGSGHGASGRALLAFQGSPAPAVGLGARTAVMSLSVAGRYKLKHKATD